MWVIWVCFRVWLNLNNSWGITGEAVVLCCFFLFVFCLCYIVVWICLHKTEIFISHGKWLVACEWPNRLIRNCVSCNWVSCSMCPKSLSLLSNFLLTVRTPVLDTLYSNGPWHWISILTKIFPHSMHIISHSLTQSLVTKIHFDFLKFCHKLLLISNSCTEPKKVPFGDM